LSSTGGNGGEPTWTFEADVTSFTYEVKLKQALLSLQTPITPLSQFAPVQLATGVKLGAQDGADILAVIKQWRTLQEASAALSHERNVIEIRSP
jgi:hypothetical protein